MKSGAAEDDESSTEIQLPGDIDWQMLDKSKFLFLGAALFSGVSAVVYPVVVLKTRQQVAHAHASSLATAVSIVKHEGLGGLYRGFGTTLLGRIPARALYMAALEFTRSQVGPAAVRLGVAEPSAATLASGAGGFSAAVAAQLVWTPVDVVRQRLMVQGGSEVTSKYLNGLDAFKRILKMQGPKGLYRGFGFSVVTLAPFNAVWWASYSVSQRFVWSGLGSYLHKDSVEDKEIKTVMVVQVVSAAVAGGLSALITAPLDTIKTRLQVLDDDGSAGKRPTVAQTVRNLVREGGWMACYKGLGPRCASMSMSIAGMVTTYEFLKRCSTKNQETRNLRIVGS